MASTPLPPDSAPTEISSLLSDPPSIALLNRVQQELGLENDPIDVEAPTLEEASREP
jgi:hypothetical protein